MKRSGAALRMGLALACAGAAFPARADVEVAGVRFAGTREADGQTLRLNGAGLRTRFFFKVYAMALYLSAPAHSAAAVLDQSGAQHIDIVTLRKLGADQFVDALIEGLEKNLDQAARSALAPQIDAFAHQLRAQGEAKAGTRIGIAFHPATGTELRIDDRAAGEPIAGEAFFDALLRVWLGEHPAQDDLKRALLDTPEH